MAALKYSRQRESIKEFLMTRKDHPTADVVYENVRKNEERYLEIEKNAQLKDMIELMLYQELYNQRCRNRRTRNQFYINGSF